MIVDTVQGDPVIKTTTMTSGGETVPCVVVNDRLEYGFIRKNMANRHIESKEVLPEIIFGDFVGYYGVDAYEKLKEIKFKFE